MPLSNVWANGGSAFTGSLPRLTNNQFSQSQAVGTPYYGSRQTQPRTQSVVERPELKLMEAVGWGVQAQADIAERPYALADLTLGGMLTRGLEALGDLGGPSRGEPGPLGQLGDLFTGFLHKTDIATGALLNVGDAKLLSYLSNAPMDQEVPEHRIDGGLLSFFSLGGRPMTKREFLEDLATRGFNLEPETGRVMSWEETVERAKQNPFNFGNAMISDNEAVNMAGRMLLNPTNLLFLVPAAGWAAAGTRVASWASKLTTPASRLLGTNGWGVGYLKDMTALGVRATRLPDVATAGRDILAGSMRTGSLRGFGWALNQIARGTKALTGYKPLPQGRLYQTVADPGLLGQASRPLADAVGGARGFGLPSTRPFYNPQLIPRMGPLARGVVQTGNLLSAYQRGALRVQLGTVGAEFATGGIDSLVESAFGKDSIADGFTSAMHSMFYNINNYHPLSQNEAFVMFSAFAFPTVPIALEYPMAGTRAIGRAIGDNDAVIFARALLSDEVKGKVGSRGEVRALYERLGEGDVKLGEQRFVSLIDWLDMHESFQSLSGAVRAVHSLDEAGYGNAAITPLVRIRVAERRQQGKYTAASRLERFRNIVRYGEDGVRQFEFNATNDYMLQFWIDMHNNFARFNPQLSEFGNIVLARAGLLTREMADELDAWLEDMGATGFISQELMNEIFRRYPQLIDNPGQYGNIWARLAVQGDVPGEGGRILNRTEDRVSVLEVRQALHEMRDDLPSTRELFHEATAAEEAAMPLVELPEPLRGIHSEAGLNRLRQDAEAQVQGLAREDRAVTRLRNSEYSRNGEPRYLIDRYTVGAMGTSFEYIQKGTVADTIDAFADKDKLVFPSRRINEKGESTYIGPGADPARAKDVVKDGVAVFDDDGTVEIFTVENKRGKGYSQTRENDYYPAYSGSFDREVWGDIVLAAVQSGSRTIRVRNRNYISADHGPQGLGPTLAELGFVEVAVGRDYTYFAFMGGAPVALFDTRFPQPRATHVREYWVGATEDIQDAFLVKFSELPQMLKVAVVEEHIPFHAASDINAMLYPLFDKNDPATFAAHKLDSVNEPIRLLTYLDDSDIAAMHAGNAVFRYRVHPDDMITVIKARLSGIDRIPVQLELVDSIDLSTAYGGGIAGFPERIVTPAELMNDRSVLAAEFPPYKQSGVTKATDQEAHNAAIEVANEASIATPSMASIGRGTPVGGLYHGSNTIFDSLDDARQGTYPFVGPGHYLTTDLIVAGGYAMAHAMWPDSTPTIYVVKLKPNLKLLDLSKKLPKDFRERLKLEIANEINSGRGQFDREPLNANDLHLLEEALNANTNGLGFILELADEWGGKTRYRFTRRMRGGYASTRRPGTFTLRQSEMGAVAQVMNAFHRAAKDLGYDGLLHEGMAFRADPQHNHNVTVLFSSASVRSLDRYSIASAFPRTQGRLRLIQLHRRMLREKIKEQKEILANIDQRAEELRTVKVDDLVNDRMSPESVQRLRELRDLLHTEYPQLDLAYKPSFLYDPADGPIGGLNLERNLVRQLLYDYGPISKISMLYNALFSPISSHKLSQAARHSVFNLGIQMGASVKEMETILASLNRRQREQVLGPMRTPWFRDIVSLPANQINSIAKERLNPTAWANVEARYGTNGFHLLLDEAANQLVRETDNAVRRGNKPGMLQRSLREGYRNWQHAPALGSTTRFIHKQFYHIFRFQLDLRWHFLNLVEADILSLFTTGKTRFWDSKPRDVSPNALLAHTSAAGLPAGVSQSIPGSVTGPAHAMELFDAGLYLHNRNLLPILERRFDDARLESVNAVLDSLPVDDPIIRQLTERFGMNRDTWSRQLDDMMYAFDTRGVQKTVQEEARKIASEQGWTPEEIAQMAPLLDRISDLNQRAYDDLIGLYTGNMNRRRVERLLNSYWLYWPISYQIKATKWLLSWMLNEAGGKGTNMGVAWLLDKRHDEFADRLANDPSFAQKFEDNRDIWFIAGMFLPTTPFDIGLSLNRGVRYVTSLIAPDLIEPYIGIDGPEDILPRMLEMGPVFTAKLVQQAINEARFAPEPGPYLPPQPLQ